MTALARWPSWTKKRWAVAGLLWLATAYPLSDGPAAYCEARRWIAWETYDDFYGPLHALGVYDADYLGWCRSLGYYHRSLAASEHLPAASN